MTLSPYEQSSSHKKRVTEYRKVFSSPIGKKVLLDLCYRFSLLTKLEPVDIHQGPHHLAYIAGTHAVLNDIIDTLNTNPLEIKQEMVENNA